MVGRTSTTPTPAIAPNFRTELTMTSPLYNSSIPVMQQMLRAMSDVLKKAEDHATQKNIDPNALLQARQFLTHVSAGTPGTDRRGLLQGHCLPPGWCRRCRPGPDTEVSFADLQALIAKALAHIGSFKPQQLIQAKSREIVLRPGTPKRKEADPQAHIFCATGCRSFFHVTTTYAILRRNGVEVGDATTWVPTD